MSEVDVSAENSPIVTILTPTYNRAHQLDILWKSLCSQCNRRFTWMVIDDGSTDDTKTVVEEMAKKSNFPVQYFFKKNGGKHTALNFGISMIKSPLTFIVDSDDHLVADAVETVINYHEQYLNDDEICGFSFLRAFPDGRINGKPFMMDVWKASYIEARINSNDMSSDKAEVYRTKCLLEFPFPEYKNEKFLGEDIVWIRMARKYKTIHVNKAVYIGEYQTDGLTQNRRRNNLSSPNGCVARAKEYLKNDICLKMRIKAYLQYLVYGNVANYSFENLLHDAPNKIMCLLLSFPALMIKILWEKEARKLRD